MYSPIPLNERSVGSVRRQLAAVALDRLARDGVQPARPDVVAERPPRLGDVGFRRVGERLQARILLQPLVVFGQHAIDLRLLQHDLGDEDVVRVAGVPPRQVAAVRAIPLEQPAPEPLSIGRNRHPELLDPRSADPVSLNLL